MPVILRGNDTAGQAAVPHGHESTTRPRITTHAGIETTKRTHDSYRYLPYSYREDYRKTDISILGRTDGRYANSGETWKAAAGSRYDGHNGRSVVDQRRYRYLPGVRH